MTSADRMTMTARHIDMLDDERYRTISAQAYRLYIHMLRQADASGDMRAPIAVAQSTMATWLDASVATAKRAAIELGEIGLVEIVHGKPKSGAYSGQAATFTLTPSPAVSGSLVNQTTGEPDHGRPGSTEQPAHIRPGSNPEPGHGRPLTLPPDPPDLNERKTEAREEFVRPMGRMSLPSDSFAYTVDVVERGDALASWATQPGIKIRNGGRSGEWLDTVKEFVRLDIPDADIHAEMRRRVAIHYRDTGETIGSLAYLATPLSQWAQTYDKAATVRPDRKAKQSDGRGFVQDGDDASEVAEAAAWRRGERT